MVHSNIDYAVANKERTVEKEEENGDRIHDSNQTLELTKDWRVKEKYWHCQEGYGGEQKWLEQWSITLFFRKVKWISDWYFTKIEVDKKREKLQMKELTPALTAIVLEYFTKRWSGKLSS